MLAEVRTFWEQEKDRMETELRKLDSEIAAEESEIEEHRQTIAEKVNAKSRLAARLDYRSELAKRFNMALAQIAKREAARPTTPRETSSTSQISRGQSSRLNTAEQRLVPGVSTD